MKEDIKELLIRWQKSSTIVREKRTVKFIADFPAKGEYAIWLKMELKLTVGVSSNNETISLQRKITTHCQAEDSDMENPNGDIDRLQKLLPEMEMEFLNEYTETETRLFQEFNPDGWMDLM